MSRLLQLRKAFCLGIAVLAFFLMAPLWAEAQMPAHGHHFSMPLNEVVQNQVNAGLYTPARRQAEVKLTDALYEKNPNRALELLQEAANLDPSFDKPWMYICDLNRGRANHLAAVSACQAAVNRLPNYGFYVIRLAEAQELANQPAAAIATYDQASAIDASNNTPDRAAQSRANAVRLRRAFGLP